MARDPKRLSRNERRALEACLAWEEGYIWRVAEMERLADRGLVVRVQGATKVSYRVSDLGRQALLTSGG